MSEHADRFLASLMTVAVVAGCSGADGAKTGTEKTQSASQAITSSFFYLRCNSTDWGVDEGSRLKPTQDPNVFTIVTHPQSAGADPCSVTEAFASAPDQWGNSQLYFAPPNQATIIEPGSSALVSHSSQATFSVQYPASGQYLATFNASLTTLSIGAAGTISGRVTQNPGSGVAGTIVSLETSSGTIATAVTNANGAYKFSNVVPGAYHLGWAVSTQNATEPTYSPASPAVSVTTGGDVVQNATCTPAPGAPCTLGPVVNDPFHQLMIVDPAVTDPAQDVRASNVSDGHLSFRYVMETLAGSCPGLSQAVCTSNFVHSWLNALAGDVVNTFSGASRNIASLLFFWPTLPDGKTLDMAQAPFQLLAVVNRTDLHTTGQGEGRLVYGIKIPGFDPTGNSMTVIFEFALPATPTSPSRLGWVNQFFALPTNGSKSCQFACASAPNPQGCALACNVQGLTDQFVLPGQLIDLRTNEQFLAPGDGSWAWRQFLLSKSNNVNQLVAAVDPESPDISLNGTDFLGGFIKTNAANIASGFLSLPIAVGSSPLLSGVSFDGGSSWNFPKAGLDEPTRHAFAGRTCNGCHFFEAQSAQSAGIPSLSVDGLFHVSPLRNHDATGQNLLSPFVTQIELPRRASFMTNQLACGTSASCAAGVDVALMQP